jgi:pimeloyl-ACP methyl ester carboxylesterase
MVQVVCVHGVAQQRETENTLHRDWAPALCGGVKLAGVQLAEAAVGCALYGDLFRPPGRHLAPGDPLIRPTDLDEFEQVLLLDWWAEAARVDPQVIAPDARTLARAPRSVQAALRALSGSRFFAGLGERALLGSLRQVRRYFHEPEIREAAQDRVSAMIDDEVRVIVGHSLGSVVAYEALCANPQWPVRALVTLGSPLGIPNLIFHRLLPAPQPSATDGGAVRGQWPGSAVRSWTNVADQGDVVALVKDLRPGFGPRVDCWVVDNGASAHDVTPYLTAVETGRAIAAGLAG